MGAFGKYISARDRRLCNRTHVCRAAKPHRRAIQVNDDCCIHRLVDPCDSLDAADRPRARRARDIRPIDCVRHERSSAVLFWLAALALSAPLISAFLAQFHGELQRTMREDFIKLARAKGLSESAVILRHAVRPALNPVLTIAGLSLGGVLGGSVIVESVLGRQGLGTLMVSAVRARDLPLVMGIVLFTSTAVWLGNALGELLQAINDKRIRDLGF